MTIKPEGRTTYDREKVSIEVVEVQGFPYGESLVGAAGTGLTGCREAA